MIDINSFSQKVQETIGEAQIIAESLDHASLEPIHLLKAASNKSTDEFEYWTGSKSQFERFQKALDASLNHLGKSKGSNLVMSTSTNHSQRKIKILVNQVLPCYPNIYMETMT